MRKGRGGEERRAAVQRRLALLSDELAVLDEAATGPPAEPTHTRIRPAPGSALEEPVVAPEPPPEGAPHGSVRSAPPQWAPQQWAPQEWTPQEWTPQEWTPQEWVPPDDARQEWAPVMTVPVPGRHAARRGSAPRVLGGLGVPQVAVLAVVVAVGLAVTSWWLLHSGSEVLPSAPATAPALVTPVVDGGAGPSAPSADATELVVDVAGRVRRPGIAVLPPGSRVVDALEAAGGARRGVDLSSLNLARLVVDGEQILVGAGAPTGAAPGTVSGAPVAGALVNLNLAGQAELETLPEVGPVTALAIISWREEHGGFASVDQLLDVDGIGEATLNTLGPLVTV